MLLGEEWRWGPEGYRCDEGSCELYESESSGLGQADDAQDAGKTSTNGRVKTQTAKESVRGW